MIYIASAYSYSPQVAYEAVVEVLATLLKRGVLALSPIAHSHVAAITHGLPTDWDWWKDLDCRYIDDCSEVWVWKDPAGQWEKSTGVQAEIAYALSKGKSVTYFSDPAVM